MKIDSDTKRILFHTGLLFALTIPFWIFNLDIKIQSLFFDSMRNTWPLGGNSAVILIYKYGIIPGVLAAAAAVITLGLGEAVKPLRTHRKAAVLLIITLALGPAFFINVVLKSYGGRPRPWESDEFNGIWKYRHALQFGMPGKGQSFPCGHCSMGFLFMSLYFAYRKRNKIAAYSALWGGALFGAAIGGARMMQGAHYATDVLWSGGIVFITAEAVYYKLLKGDSREMGLPKLTGAATYILSGLLLAGLAGGFLLSKPFYKERKYSLGGDVEKLVFKINAPSGNIVLAGPSAEPDMSIKCRGFGLPGSGYNEEFKTVIENGERVITVNFRVDGFLREINSDINISLPRAHVYEIVLNCGSGDIIFKPEGEIPAAVIFTGRGDIKFMPGKSEFRDVFIRTKRGDIKAMLGEKFKIRDKGSMILDAKKGKVVFINESGYFDAINKAAGQLTGAKEVIYKAMKKPSPALNINARRIIIGEKNK